MSDVLFQESGKSFRVGKILCIGRNYSSHAKEMNAEITESPVVFLKPGTAIIHNDEKIVIPRISSDVHHEVELVVVIGQRARHVRRERAYENIEGYAVGLDMTLRDVQAEAKRNGLPWTVAKGFDTSAPLSPFVVPQEVPDPHNLDISLRVNGILRQHSNTRQMLFRVEEMISYISTVFTLEPGDMIFTGTPEGVGQVIPGDILEAVLGSVGTLTVTVGRAGE